MFLSCIVLSRWGCETKSKKPVMLKVSVMTVHFRPLRCRSESAEHVPDAIPSPSHHPAPTLGPH
jgi:hypothetical protein